jgi:hypothetical protein
LNVKIIERMETRPNVYLEVGDIVEVTDVSSCACGCIKIYIVKLKDGQHGYLDKQKCVPV